MKKSIFHNEIVMERVKVDLIQVLYVYNYIATLALIGLLIVRYKLGKAGLAFLPIVALPWIMRNYSRGMALKERESEGAASEGVQD
jgi:hypothetical protein